MKVEKVYASYGVTVNVGNYESIRVEQGVEARIEVENGETASEAITKAVAYLKLSVAKEVQAIKKK